MLRLACLIPYYTFIICLLPTPRDSVRCARSTRDPPMVTIPGQGMVAGREVIISRAKSLQFLGIPFAQPPVGNLRFAPPKTDLPSWTGLRNASEFAPACLQSRSQLQAQDRLFSNMVAEMTFSEDCLYLNIFLPDVLNLDNWGVRDFRTAIWRIPKHVRKWPGIQVRRGDKRWRQMWWLPMGSEDSSPPSPDQYPVQREPPVNGAMPSLETKIPVDTTPPSKTSLDAKTAEMVQHLLMMNGHHESKMAALQSFQNLQNLAAGLQNLNSVSSLVAGLQGLSGLQSMPTNLQNLAVPPQNLLNCPLNLSLGANSSNGLLGNHHPPSPILNPSQTPQMPQFILASGQLVQGIQGAQLLIPTSQGITTQTILTIPVNHVTGNQMVNLALNNGQVVTTTLAQLQSLTQPHLLSAPTSSPVGPSGNFLGLSGLPTHQQQILNAMQQQPQLVSHSILNGLSTNSHGVKSPVHRTHHSYSSSDKANGSNNPIVTSSSSNNGTSNGCITSSAMSTISRLTANNTDITITPTPAPAHQIRPCEPESFRRDRSESPLSDGCDLLEDSPNEPMISEVQSNVVDGINLDEMKEFAKAFKLRRLSLGLTQTQVGQALSVTEGPAYSQSAICSALASRVLCAATRQQTVFEKLDITPKSAQKIKPVLERWMKEAEERFKSGQNHLTEFIGMEPSKKRKRRTSFTPQALELLNVHFERNTHPSGTEITALAHQLGYEREVIRIWFCNKRQALKNTVRMMSKAGG